MWSRTRVLFREWAIAVIGIAVIASLLYLPSRPAPPVQAAKQASTGDSNRTANPNPAARKSESNSTGGSSAVTSAPPHPGAATTSGAGNTAAEPKSQPAAESPAAGSQPSHP
jgi:hypothetical protein